MALDQERSSYFLDLLRNAEASGDIAALNNIRQQYLTESGTPEVYAPIASVGQQAFQQSQPDGSLGQIFKENLRAPMAPMAETADLIGWDDTADWLGEAGKLKPGFGQETPEFIEAFKNYDIGGMAENFMPAVAEQGGQLLGGLGSRIGGAGVGAGIGAGIGSIVPGAGTLIGAGIGATIGAFAGPFMFEAVQIVGPTANDLAKQRGRVEPDWSDITQALATASASGALNALGANMLPGGKLAAKGVVDNFIGNVAAKSATGALGELTTESLQALVQQTGESAFTPGGMRIDPMGALGEGIIGGGTGGIASAAMSVPGEAIASLPADQEYMRQRALAEQAALVGIDPSQQNVYDTLGGAQLGSVLEGRTDTSKGPTDSTMGYYDPMTGSSNVIVENAYKGLKRKLGKNPSRRQVQSEVRRMVSEESIDHKVFLEGLQDKTGFLDQFYNKRRKDIDAWLATKEGALYADYMEREDGHRSVAAEFISNKAREKGINASYTKSMIASIRNFLRKKEMLGFDADFSDSHIYDLITKAAVQATRGTPGAMPTVTSEGILESKGPQDPSRRRFMKQAAGAVAGAAVDPSILLEPATPTPPVAPPGFGGFGPGASAVPEYKAAVQAGEMASPSGLVSDVAGRAFDDFDTEAALEEDKVRQDQLREYEAREAETRRVEEEARQAEQAEVDEATEEKADTELYIDTLDEILSIYDEDAPASEAAKDGTLDHRVTSYAADTPFTREELWAGVNQRIESMEEPGILESRARMPKEDTVVRDISNRMSKKIRPEIAAMDIPEADKVALLDLASRLRAVMGRPARKRGIDAGDFDVFVEHSQNILDGNLDIVEEFIAPFAAQMTGTKERVRKADTRRDQRAKRIGKTDAEILKYRPKGGKHPMEGKMTYPFAMEEIDRQEKADEITAEEAEIRRLAVNNVRRVFKGKAGPTVKRTITEAVYGIGSYEDLVPWGDVYTEEQTGEMEERAEIGQAEARRTRYDPTSLTTKERTDLLEAAETDWEKSILDAAEGNPPYPDVDKFDSNQDPIFNAFQKTMLGLDTRADRLAFLRAPAEFKSETEEKEMAAFRKSLETKEPYVEAKPGDSEALLDELKKEGRYTKLSPGPITHYKESKSRVENWEVSRMNRMLSDETEDTVQIADMEYTEQGEAVDPSWYQWTDEDGDSVETPEGILESRAQQIYQSDIDPAEGVLLTHGGKLVPVKYKGITYWTSLNDFAELSKERPSTSAWRYNRESIISMSKEWRDSKINRDRKVKDEEIKRIIEKVIIPELSRETGIPHSADHMVPLRGYGLDFAWNLFPLPKSWNESLKDRSIHDSKNPQIQEFVKYMKAHAEDSGKSTMQIYLEALKASGVWKTSESIKDVVGRIEAFPEPEIAPAAMKQLGGIPRILAAYGYVHPQVAKHGKDLPFIPQGARLDEWHDVVFDEYLLESRPKIPKERDYSEHFNDGFWYNITNFLWGKPVQAIRDFNKVKRFGSERGTITAADKISDLIQRAHSSTKRAAGLETGNDLVQDVSIRSGEFYSTLSKVFARVTGREGVIDDAVNKQIIDYLIDKPVKFSSKEVEQSAKELKALITRIDTYAAKETSKLKEPLNLRGAGDTAVPRVWNIEYMATRKGKAQFLREVSGIFTPHGGKSTIFEEAGITTEDLYDAVINSGGFVQGDWTNVKADQLRTAKDIKKDQLIQQYLDSLPTEALMDNGLVLNDLQALVPRFIQKAVERTEYSKRFGKNDELLREMIKEGVTQIRAHNREVLKLKKTEDVMPWLSEKRFEKDVWDMARILRNQYGYDMANMSTRKWLQRASNTQVLFKLPLVTLASMPEFFTPMLKGDVSPHHWFMDFMAGTAWAGYKAGNGISKLLFNKHLPAMRKYSEEIGGLGIISDIQLLRELGIADIQAMGDLVATRYANPNFARGGLRAGARGGIGGKVPKRIRAVFNMQVFMQATMLTTMTEMQQLMALRNYQRHVGRRIKFVKKNSSKTLKGRQARIFKQFTQDLLDYGITESIDLDTSHGQAQMNAGALRFIDQVITRPNDATTSKAFKNPLIAPLVLFKRFITTFGNTLLTSVGNDFATKVDNTERAKQVGKVAVTAMTMYGAVMFAEILRGVIRGDLDDEDLEAIPADFKQFVRRLDRTGLLTAPGTALVNLTFPYKRGWWDSTQGRIFGEVLGPLGGDASALGDALLSDKDNAWLRFLSQTLPLSKQIIGPTVSGGGSSSKRRRKRKRRRRKRKRN